MNKGEFFFDVDKNPIICLNKLTSTYDNDSDTWINCDNNPSNDQCCNSYKGKDIDFNKVDKIIKLSEFESYITTTESSMSSLDLTESNCENDIENIIGIVESVEVNQRLLKKQYNELIFSPNEIINVDENINKFRYLELDRKLEKYDKKTYALYKNFFYIMLITSGIFFIRKQLKK